RTTPRHPFINEVWSAWSIRSAGINKSHCITSYGVGCRHLLDEFLKRQNLLPRHEPFEVSFLVGRSLLNYRYFVFFRQITNLDHEHEAIELSFRKRVGSFHLDWVLRG